MHKRTRIVAPSSSTDEESGSVHSNAGLQVQLPAAAEKKPAKKIIPPRSVPSIIAATSDDDAPLINKARNPQPLLFEENMFFAKDCLVAKERLKQTFKEAHLGGHPRCINSRCVYTLAIALQFFDPDAAKIMFTSPASYVASCVLRDRKRGLGVGVLPNCHLVSEILARVSVQNQQ